ncbi:helix-turn-helix domain-containing protein [Pirellulaceae bacterium SH449]
MEFVDETFVPSEKDAEKARAFNRALARGILPDSQFMLQREGNVEAVDIPHAVVAVLTKVLSVMSEGKPFKLIPMDEELTNQEAADILNVSKSYLDQVLDSGDICHRKVGQSRLIKLIDLLEYKKRQESCSKDALQELADEAQELQMGY